MRKFKVGDIVMIRHWDDMAREYGVDERGDIPMRYCLFQKGMRQYCGAVATIREIEQEEYIWLGGQPFPAALNYATNILYERELEAMQRIAWKEELLMLVEASKEQTLEEKVHSILEKAEKEILRELLQ